MRITAADGHQTALEVFGVAGQPPVLSIPALGVPISYYQPFLAALADEGFHAHGLELRGMPHSSITNVRRTDFGYHHLLTLDIPAALAAMPAQPAALVGHSLGGQLALLYAASNPGFAAPLPGIIVGGMFAFLVSWSQYILTLLIGGGRVVTLPLLLFNFATSGRNDITGAIGMIYILPGVLILLFTARHLSGQNGAVGGFGRL